MHVNGTTFEPCDRQAVEALTTQFCEVIKEHYLARPHSRTRVHEVLNALGATTAFIVLGTGHDAETSWAWFQQAVKQNFADNEADARGRIGN